VLVDHAHPETVDPTHADHPTPGTHPIPAVGATFPGHEAFQVVQGAQIPPTRPYPQTQALHVGTDPARKTRL